MSVEASTWAWQQELPASRKLILLALADHADKAGVCWPSNETLMAKAGVSQATLYRALSDLRKEGLLSDGTKGDHADKTWILKMRKDGDSTPLDSQGENDSSQNEKRTNKGTVNEPTPSPQGGSPWEGKKVNRKPVTEREWQIAEQIITAFNAAAGTRYSVAANLIPVVGRIREFPHYEPSHHERIIRAVFAEPWWSGHPGVQVIYGSASVFEQMVEKARAFEARGGVLPTKREDQRQQEVQETDEAMRKMNEQGQK